MSNSGFLNYLIRRYDYKTGGASVLDIEEKLYGSHTSAIKNMGFYKQAALFMLLESNQCYEIWKKTTFMNYICQRFDIHIEAEKNKKQKTGFADKTLVTKADNVISRQPESLRIEKNQKLAANQNIKNSEGIEEEYFLRLIFIDCMIKGIEWMGEVHYKNYEFKGTPTESIYNHNETKSLEGGGPTKSLKGGAKKGWKVFFQLAFSAFLWAIVTNNLVGQVTNIPGEIINIVNVNFENLINLPGETFPNIKMALQEAQFILETDMKGDTDKDTADEDTKKDKTNKDTADKDTADEDTKKDKTNKGASWTEDNANIKERMRERNLEHLEKINNENDLMTKVIVHANKLISMEEEGLKAVQEDHEVIKLKISKLETDSKRENVEQDLESQQKLLASQQKLLASQQELLAEQRLQFEVATYIAEEKNRLERNKEKLQQYEVKQKELPKSGPSFKPMNVSYAQINRMLDKSIFSVIVDAVSTETDTPPTDLITKLELLIATAITKDSIEIINKQILGQHVPKPENNQNSEFFQSSVQYASDFLAYVWYGKDKNFLKAPGIDSKFDQWRRRVKVIRKTGSDWQLNMENALTNSILDMFLLIKEKNYYLWIYSVMQKLLVMYAVRLSFKFLKGETQPNQGPLALEDKNTRDEDTKKSWTKWCETMFKNNLQNFENSVVQNEEEEEQTLMVQGRVWTLKGLQFFLMSVVISAIFDTTRKYGNDAFSGYSVENPEQYVQVNLEDIFATTQNEETLTFEGNFGPIKVMEDMMNSPKKEDTLMENMVSPQKKDKELSVIPINEIMSVATNSHFSSGGSPPKLVRLTTDNGEEATFDTAKQTINFNTIAASNETIQKFAGKAAALGNSSNTNSTIRDNAKKLENENETKEGGGKKIKTKRKRKGGKKTIKQKKRKKMSRRKH